MRVEFVNITVSCPASPVQTVDNIAQPTCISATADLICVANRRIERPCSQLE